VVRDERLVTGQNPASAVAVAESMLAALAARSPRQITESYFRAENRRDLPAILDHFAADVRFVTPDGATLAGREAVRTFYAANLEALPSLQVDLVTDLTVADQAALEWRAQGRNPTGDVVHMHGTNLVTVADGRFTRFQAYWCRTTATA
jgi:uncharacterized protein (TIGR02246 family)